MNFYLIGKKIYETINFIVDFPKKLKDNQISLIKQAFLNNHCKNQKKKEKGNFLDKKNNMIHDKAQKNFFILEDYSDDKRNKNYFFNFYINYK